MGLLVRRAPRGGGSSAHWATGHKGLKCITNENAGSLGFGTAGAAGTVPARCCGFGAHAGTASLPGKGRLRWPPPAAQAPPCVPVWSRVPGRASGCDTTTARCRRLVLREGGGGRDAKRKVSGASGSGRERGARAQGEHAAARPHRQKGLSAALPRAGPPNKLETVIT